MAQAVSSVCEWLLCWLFLVTKVDRDQPCLEPIEFKPSFFYAYVPILGSLLGCLLGF